MELFNNQGQGERVPRSGDGERQESFVRLSNLVKLIQASASYRGYPPIEANDAWAQARIWDAVGLGQIPEEELAGAFTRALESLQEGHAFGAPNVREAWRAIEAEQKRAQASGRYCSLCSELEGLLWDESCGAYRCCSCTGGRSKAEAIWGPREEPRARRGRK